MNIKEYNKFKIDHDVNEDDIAKLISCSKPTLLSKKNNNLFTVEDINIISEHYSLTDDDVIKIFFTN